MRNSTTAARTRRVAARMAWLASIVVVAACGGVDDDDQTRARIRVEAGPMTVSELGIASWDVRLGKKGATITGIDADGNPRGTLNYALRLDDKKTPVLFMEGDAGDGSGVFRLSRRGLRDRSLLERTRTAAFGAAVARDVAAGRRDAFRAGPAKTCAERLSESTETCARVVLACQSSQEECGLTSRECLYAARAANRCQRRSL